MQLLFWARILYKSEFGNSVFLLCLNKACDWHNVFVHFELKGFVTATQNFSFSGNYQKRTIDQFLDGIKLKIVLREYNVSLLFQEYMFSKNKIIFQFSI